MNVHSFRLERLMRDALEINALTDQTHARAGRGGSAARRALRKAGPKAGAVRPGLPGPDVGAAQKPWRCR